MASFDDDDEIVIVGQRMPRLVSVAATVNLTVEVMWEPDTRPKDREVVDLGVLIARFKIYAPLRDDPDLFRTVRLQEHRFGVAWGDGSIEMGASTIADAADEVMTAEDFAEFMDRHGFTLDRAAAELGISRRMAAYYKKQARVPRTVALACRYIDERLSVALPTNEHVALPSLTLDHVQQLAAIAIDSGERFTAADASAAVAAKAAVDEAFRKVRSALGGRTAEAKSS